MSVLSGDTLEAVAESRRQIRAATVGEAGHLQWLTQTHGHRCIKASTHSCQTAPEADAAWTDEKGIGLAIQTADCVPIVVAYGDGSRIGAAHGGWRGLVGGLVGQLIDAMASRESADAPHALTATGDAMPALLAWIGPAIGPDAYEVGEDVHAAVLKIVGLSTGPSLFRIGERPGKWHLDLFALAEWLLRQAGVAEVRCERICTWSSPNLYSYRRDGTGTATGHLATLVWMEQP